MYAFTDVAESYSDKICLSCTNAFQEITSHEVIINVRGKCEASLSITNRVNNLDVEYAPSTDAKFTFATDWSTVFVNQQPTFCKVNSCVLKDRKCISDYSGDRLSMSSSSPYQIQYVKNIENGYQEEICIQCSNGF